MDDDARLGYVKRGGEGSEGKGCDLPLGRLGGVVCLRVCARLKEGQMLWLWLLLFAGESSQDATLGCWCRSVRLSI